MIATESTMVDGVSVLAVSGEMTIYHAAELKAPLLAAFDGVGNAVLDLSQVSEADSSGLQLMLMLRDEAARRGGKVLLHGASPAVREVMDTARVADSFEIRAA